MMLDTVLVISVTISPTVLITSDASRFSMGDGDAATSQKKGRLPTPDKDVEEKHKKQGEVAVI